MWTAVTPGGRISSTPSERIDREIVVHQLHADEPITAAEARQLARALHDARALICGWASVLPTDHHS
jgi:hypothetical protein